MSLIADKFQLLKFLEFIEKKEADATDWIKEHVLPIWKGILKHIRSLSEGNALNYQISEKQLCIHKERKVAGNVEIVVHEAPEGRRLYIMKTLYYSRMEVMSNLILANCEFLPDVYFIEFHWKEKKILMFMEYFEDAATLSDLIRMKDFGKDLMKNDVYRLQLFTRFCIVKIMPSLLRMHESKIVHNDVQGYNIMFDVTGKLSKIKLIDLGLSFISKRNDDRDFEDEYETGIRFIKRLYMIAKSNMKVTSPEDAGNAFSALPEVLDRKEIKPLCDELLTVSEIQLVEREFAAIFKSMLDRNNEPGETACDLFQIELLKS